METVRVWKSPEYPDVELMCGTGITEDSPSQVIHAHQEYEFAVVEAGIGEGLHQGSYHRGQGTLIRNSNPHSTLSTGTKGLIQSQHSK